MKQKFIKGALIGLLTAVQSITAYAALPTATSLVEEMGFGYNIGNTMEVPENPTLWGNSVPTKQLIDSVKAAGFNTVRIPTAWFTHSNTSTNTISSGWLDTVKTVVDYCIDNDMYVIVNSHWDKGWLENNIFPETNPVDGSTVDTASIRQRQYDYWTQIAQVFKDYDEHLLFAGANEPGVNDPWGNGPEYTDDGQYGFGDVRTEILQRLHQAFIDAVRGTGGNNATRTLIVQMPRTEFSKADLLIKYMPTDPAGAGYLMTEFHFYPYQFTLMKEDESWGKVFYYWGDENHPTDTDRNDSWGGPDYVDDAFEAMKTKFTDKGIPVVIGEMGAMKRLTTLTGDNLARHLRSRAAFYGYVAESAKKNGIIPVIWDTGAEDDLNMTIIHRQTGGAKAEIGSIADYEVLNAIREAYGLDTLEGNSIDAFVESSLNTDDKALSLTYDYTVIDTSYSTIRISPPSSDLSEYTGISIDAYVSGTAVDVGGSNGFFTLDLAVMTGSSWDWTDTHFPELTYDSWQRYEFEFTDDATTEDQVLQLTDASKVNAFCIQAYLKGFTGNVQIDNVLLLKADGTVDTLETFNKKVPETEGAITSAELVTMTGKVAVSDEIKALEAKNLLTIAPMPVSSQATAMFNADESGSYQFSLLSESGKTVTSETVDGIEGKNRAPLSMFMDVEPGVYYVLLSKNGKVKAVKRVVKTQK